MKSLVGFAAVSLSLLSSLSGAQERFVESDYQGSTFIVENTDIPDATSMMFPPFFASDSFSVGVPNNILVEGLETSPALQDFWVNMVPQQVLAQQHIDQNDIAQSVADLPFSLDSFSAIDWGFNSKISAQVSKAWNDFYSDRSFVKVEIKPSGSYLPVSTFNGVKGENDATVVTYQCLVGVAVNLTFEITAIERTNGKDSSGLQALVGQKFVPNDSAGVRPTFIKDFARSRTKSVFSESDVAQFREECLAN